MSNFTPLVTKEYEFEGDKVKVTFKRLTRKQMLDAIPLMNKINDLNSNDADLESTESLTAINDFLNDIIDELPSSVIELEGLNDADGNAVSITTVVDDMYFMKLAALICMDVVRESAPLQMDREGN